MERGRIAWYSMNLGHGFILPEAGGPNVFVRRENIVVAGDEERTLENNDMVCYEVTQSAEGPEAKNVSKV
jgi:cold shock CspA family protein